MRDQLCHGRSTLIYKAGKISGPKVAGRKLGRPMPLPLNCSLRPAGKEGCALVHSEPTERQGHQNVALLVNVVDSIS